MAKQSVRMNCPRCGGRGWITKPKVRVDGKGKTRTEQTQEACPTCHWTGVITR